MKEKSCVGCKYNINVGYLRRKITNIGGISFPITTNKKFVVTGVDFDELIDLALLKVSMDKEIPYAVISKIDPKLGDDLWIASNPDQQYRSLKKGIISSINNRIANLSYVWEISGGVVFGSSGGGAFDAKGELFGIIRAVNMFNTPYCYQIFKKMPENQLKLEGRRCIRIPVSFIGMIVRPEDIRNFVINSYYNEHFEYLK